MAFAAGVFSRLYNWVTEQASPPIEIAKLDAQEEDFATAFNNCLLRDGTGLPTANADWNGKKITNLATPTASTDATTKAYVDARGFPILSARRTTALTRSSNSTSSDPVLQLALAANSVYIIDLLLVGGGLVAGASILGGISYSGTKPALTTFAFIGSYPSATPQLISVDGGDIVFSGLPGAFAIEATGFARFILRTVNAGTLAFEWASNTNGTDAQICSGSFLMATNIT